MVRILLADDHAIIRNGLKIIILNYRPDAVIDNAGNGASVMDCLHHHDYSLIILDLNMPKTDAPALVSDILSYKPETRILIFSINNEEFYAKRFMQLGAMGYISKGSPESEIIKAIDNILNNKKYLSSTLLETLTSDIKSNKYSNPFNRLSNRERQILPHLLNGKGVTYISSIINVEPSTAGTYKARIMKKLKCKSVRDIRTLAKAYHVSIT